MSEYNPDGTRENSNETSRSPRQRAIEAYENAGRRAADSLGEAPLLALAGGIAAGALIAALLPRTDAETKALRPAARRVKDTARQAFSAAKDTGSKRLDELGLSTDKASETIRNLFGELTDAAKASGSAAL